MVMLGCFMGLLAVGVFSLRFACTPMDFREDIRSAELAQMRRASEARIEAREQVVRELIDQRYTLAEAIEQFLELDRQWPELISKAQADRSQEERIYDHISLRVQDVLHDHPEQASNVLRRLEQEFEKLRSERQTPSTADKNPTEHRSANKK
jgi:hypothetical protein